MFCYVNAYQYLDEQQLLLDISVPENFAFRNVQSNSLVLMMSGQYIDSIDFS